MRKHYSTLQGLQIALGVLNGLWAAWATFFFAIFTMAGQAGNGNFPGLSAAGYNIYMIVYLSWALFAWVSCLLNFFGAFWIGNGRHHGLCMLVAGLNLVPMISCLWVVGIPVGVYGLYVTLNRRTRTIFRLVQRGMSFDQAVDEEADAFQEQPARRRQPLSAEEIQQRDRDDRNDPPRESW